MSNRTIQVDDKLYAYILEKSLREPEVLRRLREETARMPEHNMQIAPDQGQFMQMLVRMLGARRCIEVGVFTGYSSLAVALALPADGLIVACDVSAEYTKIAQRYWREAGVAARIQLKIAPALQTLDALVAGGGAGSFDFAFVDADKTSYAAYYERLLTLLRPGGVIAVDNVLWNGAVLDAADTSESTRAIRAFNDQLARDERIDLSLVPIGDGVTLARKR
jgi:predicted O-methyltransferase YrrM